jgi:L-asparaginase
MTYQMEINKPKVQIITLGGTIAMRRDNGGLSPALAGDGLLGFLRDVDLPLQIDWMEFVNIASANITFTDLLRLAQHITSLSAEHYSGVVVTQGTDTIEETAFALELLSHTPINIAVTGAMRGASHPSADGPANIISALRFLADSNNSGEVVVVLDDTVHSARYVRKTHTTRLSSFSSGEFGLRGRIHEDHFRPYNKPPSPFAKIPIPPAHAAASVLLLPICLGMDPSLLQSLVKINLGGIVLEALGAGHVPQILVPILAACATDIPVVLCSRADQGSVCEHTYGYPGGEIDLLARGLLSGGWLPGNKARILLELLLMNSPVTAKERFSDYVRSLS